MMEPIKASEVERKPGAPDAEIQRQRAKAAVQQRRARAEALRRNGGLGEPSAANTGNVEDRVKKAGQDVMADFRRRRAGAAKSKTGG